VTAHRNLITVDGLKGLGSFKKEQILCWFFRTDVAIDMVGHYSIYITLGEFDSGGKNLYSTGVKEGTPMNNTSEMRITMSPEICGGAPCIRGTRIRVVDIATYYEIYGWSPETIVEELEGITLADVHSALAYYFDNIEEFRKHAQEENVLIENLRKNLPSALKKKLLGTA